MHAVQKQFHDFIESNHLIKSGDKVLLAVSGGVDSMVMAELFLASAYTFAIAHCNYGLRGEESDQDEQFVTDWAERHEVTCHNERFEIGDKSIQLEARRVRYEWFEKLCKTYNYNKVATAHHQNDSLETVLINLTRGTGIKGLTGIAVSSGKVIRPMLFATREDVESFAKEMNIVWREDSSNEKIDYDRNRIRHEVIPQLEALNPSLLRTFERTADRLSLSYRMLAEEAERIRATYLTKIGEEFRLDLEWLVDPMHAIILHEIIDDYGFDYSTVKKIIGSRNSPGKMFISTDWRLAIDRGALLIYKREEEDFSRVKLTKTGNYSLPSGELNISLKPYDEVTLNSDPNLAFLDSGLITFPLEIRTWEKGDYFQPLGMHGHKKLSDFLIDLKVPLKEKNRQLVVQSQKEIVWVVGKRIAESYKISKETEVVLTLKWSPLK